MRIQCLENLRIPPQSSSTEGESGPKIRPKGIVDGQQVNIPILSFIALERRRRLGDATHGSLALKAYQQNLYLKYYY